MNQKIVPATTSLVLLFGLAAAACAAPVESDELADGEGEVATTAEALVVNYSYQNIQGINLNGLNREGSNFTGANMTNARAIDTDLDGATFYGTTGPSTRFNHTFDSGNATSSTAASLKNTVFYGANFYRAIFNNCKMTNVYAIGATLAESEFFSADLSGSGTRLDGANLQWSQMNSAKFTSATLNNADFEHVTAQLVDFSSTKANQVDFRAADLRLTSFQSASLRGSDFQGADIRNANFNGADLTGANTCNVIKNAGTTAVGAIQTGNCRL
jgi:uncharacterized protein YjbI with pentapeptide repeats